MRVSINMYARVDADIAARLTTFVVDEDLMQAPASQIVIRDSHGGQAEFTREEWQRLVDSQKDAEYV